ncbi:hypothetical protein HY523_01915 [Candidatus Berkelbacteria bacterium]|nr:hypothetical protein [Candidatus Berkelbacteria bacterium]
MEDWRRYRHPRVYRTPSEVKPWRFRPSRPMLLVGLSLMALGALVWLLFGSPIFTVTTIRLEGEVSPAAAERLQALTGTRIFLIRASLLTDQVAAVDASLASLRIAKGLPNQLNVYVTRRHPALVWQVGEIQWAIDPAGIVFPLDPTTIDHVPRVIDRHQQMVTAGIQLLDPDFVTFIQEGFQELPAILGGSLAYAEVGETTFDVRFVTEWGWAIIVDAQRPLAGQLANFQILFDHYRDAIREYADLRIAGTAYLK